MSFESLIQEKFIEFLNDFKFSFENQQKTIFPSEQEAKIKLFFKFLKEYIWKLKKYGSIASFELQWLIQDYEGFSICDILAISDDFALKYDILYLLWKFNGNTFINDKPPNPKSSHFQKLWEYLFLYADASRFKWVEECKKPIFVIIDNETNGIFLSENSENEEAINLEHEFQDFSEFLKKNIYFKQSPNDFVRYLLEKGKYQLSFKVREEIKMAITLYYSDDAKQRLLGHDYFGLASYLSSEILKSRNSLFYNIINL